MRSLRRGPVAAADRRISTVVGSSMLTGPCPQPLRCRAPRDTAATPPQPLPLRRQCRASAAAIATVHEIATSYYTQQPQQQPAPPMRPHVGAPLTPAAAAAAPPPVPGNAPSVVLSRSPLAGGMLEVVQWCSGDRNVRVWLPPGYSRRAAALQPWPVLYMADGQNLFGDCHTLSGCSWQAAETAAALITSGRLPPFLIVGVDHAGPNRSLEYTPYVPGTGPGGFRADAANWPGGGVAAYLQRLKQQILPWVAAQYGGSLDPADLALGGASFGGIAALAAGMRLAGECPFGALLVESPSLWIADEAFLRDIQNYVGAWPQRVYVGMGGKEYSGTRSGRGGEHDKHFPRYLKAVYTALTEQGLGPDRLAWAFEPNAAHTEAAWAERLPDALQFVAAAWWPNWLKRRQQEAAPALAAQQHQQQHQQHQQQRGEQQQHGQQQPQPQQAAGALFSWPPQLCADAGGQLLFFNRNASTTLARLPEGTRIKAVLGFNGWQQTSKQELQPMSVLAHHHIAPPGELQREVFQQWGLQPELHDHLLRKQQQLRAAGSQQAANGGAGDWHVLWLPHTIPDCHQLDLAFCDAAEQVWDNNGGKDYHVPVSKDHGDHADSGSSSSSSAFTPARGNAARWGGTVAATAAYDPHYDNIVPAPRRPTSSVPKPAAKRGSAARLLRTPSASKGPADIGLMASFLMESLAGDGCGLFRPEALLQASVQVLRGADAPAEAAATAAEASGQLAFMMPPQPVAGMPVTVYINKAKLGDAARRAPNMSVTMGFNDWNLGEPLKAILRPTSLRRGDNMDWWCCRLDVPFQAKQGAFAISAVFNGHECWENNNGANWEFRVGTLEDDVMRAFTAAADETRKGSGELVRAVVKDAICTLELQLDAAVAETKVAQTEMAEPQMAAVFA